MIQEDDQVESLIRSLEAHAGKIEEPLRSLIKRVVVKSNDSKASNNISRVLKVIEEYPRTYWEADTNYENWKSGGEAMSIYSSDWEKLLESIKQLMEQYR